MKQRQSDAIQSGFSYSLPMENELKYANGNLLSPPDSSRILRIVIDRDESGYGMTVSGDNPVYVQSVKGGGAAEKSGLHIGDTIIKVNGVNVMQSTHTEVVALIRSSSQAVLTVQQRAQPSIVFEPLRRMAGGSPNLHQNRHSMNMPHSNSNSRITAPRPVDHEKLRQLEFERVHTFRLMLEKEQQYVDSLRSDLAKYADNNKVKELSNAERRVRKLQEQLQNLLNNQTQKTSLSNYPQNESYSLSASSTSIHNCNTLPCTAPLASAAKNHQNSQPKIETKSPSCDQYRNQSKTKSTSESPTVNYHSRSNSLSPENSILSKSSSKHSIKDVCKLPIDEPPPLPKRNRDMQAYCEIVTTTCLDDLVDLSTPVPSPTSSMKCLLSAGLNDNETPPPLPPRNPSMISDVDSSNSINKQMSFPLVSTCTPLMANCSYNCQTNIEPNGMLKAPLVCCRQPVCPVEVCRRLDLSQSMSDLSHSVSADNTAWNSHATPPGTPPPPYPSQVTQNYRNCDLTDVCADLSFAENVCVPSPINDNCRPSSVSTSQNVSTGSPIIAASSNVKQQSIISMEDDDMSDQEINQFDDHGPFKSLSKLWQNTAHLAVFTNYVLSNSDPCSLLFYLLTDLYKEGNAKEMRKWAYEIHSCFLVPGAPLRLNNVDENIAREIDEVLLKEFDKEEIMRGIFWKARNRAKEELNEQLADFQQKRTAGLGTIFGPPDLKLDEISHDKTKASKLYEELLLAKLDPYLEELEKEFGNPRKCLLASAIATVISKTFGVRPLAPQSSLNRCPTFISKGKSFKSKLIGRNYRKVTVYGHHYTVQQYYAVLSCNHCHQIIFGVGPQGYQCSVCLINLHRSCVNAYKDYCPGPIIKKDRCIGKFMDRIRPENRETRQKKQNTISTLANNTVVISGANIANHIDPEKKHSDDGSKDCSFEVDISTVDKPNISVSRASSDRRPDIVNEEPIINNSIHDASHVLENNELLSKDSFNVPRTRSAQSSINRSESYKEQTKKRSQIRERRKVSDPNLSKTTNASNVDSENQSLLNNAHSGSSSNSSLSSRSFDSPSLSCENTFNTNHQVQQQSSHSWDSDIEVEPDPPDWHCFVPEEILTNLHPYEKKRQEAINELFHTERSHVRNLRVLETVFYRPLLSSKCLPVEQVKLLFSNLEEMIEIHTTFNAAMKQQRKESVIVGDVGNLLLEMFDGASGEEFQRAAATFCARQQIALESLKERRRKDQKLHAFLNECESDKLCKRLQLKDIIPTGMLRLTKYPLLFESIVRYTDRVLAESSNEPIITTTSTPNTMDTDSGTLTGSDQNINQSSNTNTENQTNMTANSALNQVQTESQPLPIAPNSMSVINFGPSQVELPKLRRAVERSKEILNFVNQAVREAEDCARLQDVQKRLDKTAFEKVEHPIAIEFRNLDLTTHKLIHEGPLTWRIGKQKFNLHVLLLEDIIILLQKQDEKFVLKFYSSSIERTPQLSPIVKISTVLVRSNAVDKDSLFLVNTSHVGAQIYDLVASSPNERSTWFRHISDAAEAFKVREGKFRQSEFQSPDFHCTVDSVDNNLVDISQENIDNDRPSTTVINKTDEKTTADSCTVDNQSNEGNTTIVVSDTTTNSKDLIECDKTYSEKILSNPDISNVGDGSFAPYSTGLNRIVSGSFVTNDSTLIAPSEVVVDFKPVFTALPLLSNIEQIKRKDDLVSKTLEEKRSLVAEVLQIPFEEYDTIVDIAGHLEDGQHREPIEILLAAINKVNTLLSMINDASTVNEIDQVIAASGSSGGNSEMCSSQPQLERQQQKLKTIPSIPVHKLVDLVNTLNTLLTTLLVKL